MKHTGSEPLGSLYTTRFWRTAWGLFLLCCSWIAGPGLLRHLPLEANVTDALGLSARAISPGNACTSAAEDFSAVYYNPAGLSYIPESKLAIGGIWARPNLYYKEQG